MREDIVLFRSASAFKALLSCVESCQPADMTTSRGDFLFPAKVASLSGGRGLTSRLCFGKTLTGLETDFRRPKNFANRPVEELVGLIGSKVLTGTTSMLGNTIEGSELPEIAVDSTTGFMDAICCRIFSDCVAVESLEPLRRRRLGLRKMEVPMLDLSRGVLFVPVDAEAGGKGDRDLVLFLLSKEAEVVAAAEIGS